MELKREKQTDWRGTVGGFVETNNRSGNTESDEKSPEYIEWRKKEEKILIPSDTRIEKIKYETTNDGKQKRRGRSLSTTSNTKEEKTSNKSTREEQEDVIINEKKANEPKSADGREMGE